MGYDWSGSFGDAVNSPSSDYEEKMARDQLQAQLAQETMMKRNQLEVDSQNEQFRKQLEMLQQSNEYTNSNMQKRAALEAQLIALQKGNLPKDMANGLLQSGGFNPIIRQSGQPAGLANNQGSYDAENVLGAFGMTLGGATGMKMAPRMGPAATKASDFLKAKESFGNIADDLLKNGSGKVLDATEAVTGKYGARPGSIYEKLMRGTAKGGIKTAAGLDSLGLKLAGKGSTKVASGVLGKIGARGVGKVAGAALGGVPGFLIGTALGEIVGKMMDSDDESERAKAQYMIDNM